jgi:hypothetical protein
MAEYWVVYFDLEGFKVGRSFRCLAPKSLEARLPEDRLILGGGLRKDIYLCWHHWFVNQTRLHLATCTHTELTLHEVREVVFEAIKFAEEQCQ